MPGGFTAGVNAATNRRQVQLQAQRDAEQLRQTQRVEDQQDNVIAAIAQQAEAEAAELRAEVNIGKLDNAFTGIAEGNFDDFEDFIADPENADVLKSMPALTEAFPGGIRNVRRFNPNEPNDVEARNALAAGMFGDNKTYDEMFEGQRKFIDDNTVIVETPSGPRAVRSDEFLELLGSTERRAKARRTFNDNNVKLATTYA